MTTLQQIFDEEIDDIPEYPESLMEEITRLKEEVRLSLRNNGFTKDKKGKWRK
jgi:hypothetical protein